jgi:hypothetical protein
MAKRRGGYDAPTPLTAKAVPLKPSLTIGGRVDAPGEPARVAGEVDEQLLAGDVGRAHGRRDIAAPLAVEIADRL